MNSMSRTAWGEGMPRLRITSGVSEWLGAIAEASRDEVQVLFVGSPDENRVEAGFITLGQENTASSVSVPPDAFAESVVEAKRLFGKPVLGMAHLHPGGMGAFASIVDEKNLVSLAELLSKPLLRPLHTVRTLVLTGRGEWALDPYGRKVVRAGKSGSAQSRPGPQTDGPGLSLEYVETRMAATVWSVTFSRKKTPRGEDRPALYAQALDFTYCCDPDCATPKKVLTDDVPVEVLADDEFAWSWEEVESELRQRVRVKKWSYGGYGYGYGCGWGQGYSWNSGRAYVEVTPSAESRGHTESDSSRQRSGPQLGATAADPPPGSTPRPVEHGQRYRYLTGHEDVNELRAMVQGIKDEIGRRLGELGAAGEA